MAARAPRRAFAPPFVITLAGAATLAACGGGSPKVLPTGPNPPSHEQSTAEAYWRVDTVEPDACTATPCTDAGGDCPPEHAKPYPCIAGRPSVVIIRAGGAIECAYNGAPMPAMPDCPPELSCNPPPPEWKPIAVVCPDAP